MDHINNIIQKTAQVNSPSEFTEWVQGNVAKGLAVGWNNEFGNVLSTVSGSMKQLNNVISHGAASTSNVYNNSSSKITNITINSNDLSPSNFRRTRQEIYNLRI